MAWLLSDNIIPRTKVKNLCCFSWMKFVVSCKLIYFYNVLLKCSTGQVYFGIGQIMCWCSYSCTNVQTFMCYEMQNLWTLFLPVDTCEIYPPHFPSPSDVYVAKGNNIEYVWCFPRCPNDTTYFAKCYGAANMVGNAVIRCGSVIPRHWSTYLGVCVPDGKQTKTFIFSFRFIKHKIPFPFYLTRSVSDIPITLPVIGSNKIIAKCACNSSSYYEVKNFTYSN